MDISNEGQPTDIQEHTSESSPLREKKSKNAENFKDKLKDFFRNITVEPVIGLFFSAIVLTAVIDQNFILVKTCRVTLNYTDEICTALRKQELEAGNSYEASVQKITASLGATKTLFTATLPSFLMLLTGSWSDRTGNRKILAIIPSLGLISCCIYAIINNIFFYEISALAYVIGFGLMEAFSGGAVIVVAAIYSHVSAITTDKNRTYRLGLLTFCQTASIPIGMGLSGYMLKTFSFITCYSIIGLIHVLNVIYCVFILKDAEKSPAQEKFSGQGFVAFFKTFFDLRNVKQTFVIVFKNGPNRRRLRMCVLLSLVSILYGPMYGEISILYLTTRYRFNWDEMQFSIFQTYNFVVHTVGTIFSILVFSKYLGWHDSILGIVSTTGKIAASFIYCFAKNDKIFFIAPLVEILSGTGLLALRTITSKLVATDELGKLNSLFGLIENLMPLVYVPLYAKVYTATMDTLPGFIFLLGAMMTVPGVIVFFWLFYEHRKNVKATKREIKLQPFSE